MHLPRHQVYPKPCDHTRCFGVLTLSLKAIHKRTSWPELTLLLSTNMIIAPSSHSRAPSRAASPFSYNRIPDPPLPFMHASSGVGDFQVEHATRTPRRQHSLSMPIAPVGYDEELVYREHVSSLLAAKNTVFSVSGRIPLDPSQLVLFFRTKVLSKTLS